MHGIQRFTPWFLAILCAGLLPAQYSSPPGSPRERGPFPWPAGKRAAVSLSFDDARPSQIDNGIPLFARYGVRVTFYASPPRLRDRLEGWKKASAAGHEIANHSASHPCSGNFPWSRGNATEELSLARMRGEMAAANNTIRDLLGVTPATFAYPCGQKTVGRGTSVQSYVPLVAEMFLAGRGWRDEGPNDPWYCDLAQIYGTSCDNADFEEIKPLVDQAAERGQWLVLAGHDIGSAAERQTTRVAMLEALCRYAQEPQRGIWIDTVQAVAAYIGDRRARAELGVAVYQDPKRGVHERVEDLLRRMTLEEKIGQMNMPCVYVGQLGKTDDAKMEACRGLAAGTFAPGIGPGGGFFTLANTILHKGARQQAEFFNELQRIALEKTRLRIPLLQTEEGTHGLMCSGGTIFPEGPAIGSTWDMDLVRRIYSTAAREARSVGIHQLFTLVIEPNRDPRLGRNQEGYSEDPYLCSRIAEAIVAGAQGKELSSPESVVAGLCHYPGQSQPVGGLERGAMEISERTLREVFLPPWIAGIRKSGALGVMATYPAIDGVPVHGSEWILTRILRGELGFEGLVLSEGSGISTLLYEGLAADEMEAGELALRAGVDVGISYERAFMQDLAESVRKGRTPVELIDRAVRRILGQKIRLGLFENPIVDVSRVERTSHAAEHRNLALQAAREGIVLLKNAGNILPLPKSLKSIAVIGPNADNARNQLGDYTALTILQEVVTVLEGIKRKVGAGTKITYVKGCNVVGDATAEIEAAQKAARGAEAAIVVVGENEWRAPRRSGTNGEGYDVATLELTGRQEELIKAVHAAGKPVVLVLINGRPLAIRWAAENVPAILEAWLPGEQGGAAVADILFGDWNPEGKLPVTVPRHAGQLPVYYNFKPSKEHWLEHGWGKPYADMNPEPLFDFGFGLSYTRFEYSGLEIAPARIAPDGQVRVRITLRNAGGRRGTEVAQLYLRDSVSSVVTPVKQLRGFERVTLDPGQSKTVEFLLGPEDMSLLDRELRRVVEPGGFQVMVGASSRDIRLTGRFEAVPR